MEISEGKKALMWAETYLDAYAFMTRFNKETVKSPEYGQIVLTCRENIEDKLSIAEREGEDITKIKGIYNQFRSEIEQLINE